MQSHWQHNKRHKHLNNDKTYSNWYVNWKFKSNFISIHANNKQFFIVCQTRLVDLQSFKCSFCDDFLHKARFYLKEKFLLVWIMKMFADITHFNRNRSSAVESEQLMILRLKSSRVEMSIKNQFGTFWSLPTKQWRLWRFRFACLAKNKTSIIEWQQRNVWILSQPRVNRLTACDEHS